MACCERGGAICTSAMSCYPHAEGHSSSHFLRASADHCVALCVCNTFFWCPTGQHMPRASVHRYWYKVWITALKRPQKHFKECVCTSANCRVNVDKEGGVRLPAKEEVP